MDNLASLVLAAVALEALMQLLRSVWDENVRKKWNITTIILYLVAVVMVFLFSDWNIVAGSGLDLGSNEVIGKLLTGLSLARVSQWVHDFYWKTRTIELE